MCQGEWKTRQGVFAAGACFRRRSFAGKVGGLGGDAMRRQVGWLLLALLLLAGAAPAGAQPALAPAAGAQPAWSLIYGVQGNGFAAVPVPPGWFHWQVESLEGGQVAREFAPAEADGTVRVPLGGWYRLVQRDRAGATRQVGHRFAVGYLVVVTGQSQADALFYQGAPDAGAFRAEADDPALPAVHGVLYDCLGRPGCGPDGTHWGDAGQNFGVRVLLAELSWRLHQAPVALAGAAWGGASIAQLADAHGPAGRRLRRVVHAAAPASAALLLGHGTTDAFLGTSAAQYGAGLGVVVAALRAGGGPGMPVLQAPLGPLDGRLRLLGSEQLASWLAPQGRDALLARLGLTQAGSLGSDAVVQAAVIRSAQVEAARALGLQFGGDISRLAPGADGVHWSREGVRHAARQVAEAVAAALRP